MRVGGGHHWHAAHPVDFSRSTPPPSPPLPPSLSPLFPLTPPPSQVIADTNRADILDPALLRASTPGPRKS